MKDKDVVMGEIYLIRVSGWLAAVQIQSVTEGRHNSISRRTGRPTFHGPNLRTGKTINAGAGRLRGRAPDALLPKEMKGFRRGMSPRHIATDEADKLQAAMETARRSHTSADKRIAEAVRSFGDRRYPIPHPPTGVRADGGFQGDPTKPGHRESFAEAMRGKPDPVTHLDAAEIATILEGTSPEIAFAGTTSPTPGWYHYDETWSHLHGPFDSEEAANAAMKRYCETFLAEAPSRSSLAYDERDDDAPER